MANRGNRSKYNTAFQEVSSIGLKATVDSPSSAIMCLIVASDIQSWN